VAFSLFLHRTEQALGRLHEEFREQYRGAREFRYKYLRVREIAADRPLHADFRDQYRRARDFREKYLRSAKSQPTGLCTRSFDTSIARLARPPLWRLRNSGENDDTDTA
jgi:hypothetical protein